MRSAQCGALAFSHIFFRPGQAPRLDKIVEFIFEECQLASWTSSCNPETYEVLNRTIPAVRHGSQDKGRKQAASAGPACTSVLTEVWAFSCTTSLVGARKQVKEAREIRDFRGLFDIDHGQAPSPLA